MASSSPHDRDPGDQVAHHETGGFAEPGYGAVADAFRENFDRGDVGAACALYVDGELVVDLWGGVADPRTNRPWERDTVAIVFSVTKGVASIAAQMLVERGELELDVPVTTYWPQYGAAGKEQTTVRDVLSHRTGLPAVDGRPVTIDDVEDPQLMAARLAAQTPLFEPGTAHAYQAFTFSWTFGEIFRRVVGESIGTFVAREIAAPLGLDLWIGLPEQVESRVAPILPPDVPAELVELVMPEGSLPWRSMTLNGLRPTLIAGDDVGINDPRIHRIELTAANGITNARSLAKLYAATIGTVDGIRLIQPQSIAAASVVRSEGLSWGELVEGPRWGTGFLRPFPRQPMLEGASFGHDGAGGSIAFAEPDLGVAFGHVINQMVVTDQQDVRTMALLDAVRSSIA
ncbi:serine hydrolase domain-containing protein [soil metagenome]